MKKTISVLMILALLAVTFTAVTSCGDNTNTGKDTTVAEVTSGETTGAGSESVTETGTETEAPAADKDLQSMVDLGSVNGTAGASDTEGAVNIFDGDSSTKWCALQKDISVEWKMTEAVTINYYYFTTANDEPGRNPANWVLSGSSDGSNWTELSNVQAATLPTEFLTDSDKYTVDNPQSFQYYKLEIIDIADPALTVTQFSEFNFFQSAK